MTNNTARPQSAQTTGTNSTPMSATIDGEMLPLRVEVPDPEFDSIDAVARLLLGGAADLSDLFLKLVEHWEGTVVAQHEATLVEEEEDLGDIVRYLLIGLAFQSQRQARSTAERGWLLRLGRRQYNCLHHPTDCPKSPVQPCTPRCRRRD